jgi:hypothetical protein
LEAHAASGKKINSKNNRSKMRFEAMLESMLMANRG